MRRPSPVLVICAITVVASLVSVFFGGRERAWDIARALHYEVSNEVIRWWMVWLPLGVGAALIGSYAIVSASRALRSGRRSDALDLVLVACLGVLAFSGTLVIPDRLETIRLTKHVPKVPRSANQVFTEAQWRNAERLRGTEGPGSGERNANGIGFRDQPGLIPFDPFLLKRVSFLGLRREQAKALLGEPRAFTFRPGQMIYYGYLGGRRTQGHLILELKRDRNGETRVTREWQEVRRHPRDGPGYL